MSFDFQAFMQGFLETRTADIQEKKGEARAYKERMRLMSERNASIAKQRTDMYQSSKTMGDKLLQMGASPDMIQAALKSGQKGLTSLYQTVTTVHEQLNDAEAAKAWLKDEANKTIVHDLGSAQGVGTEGLDALYRETVGLPTGSKIGDYTYEQPDFLGKILGKTDYMEEARSQLDAEQGMYGGFSTYDLATIGRLPDYMPGSQGETFSIVAPKIYTPDAFAEETDMIAEKVKQARSSDEYASALRVFTEADKAFITADRAGIGEEKFGEIERQRTEAKEKMDAVLARSLQLPIRNAASSYYNETTYLTDMAAELQNTLGFTPDWLLDDIEVSKAADAQLEGEGDTPKDPKTNEIGPLVVRTIKDEDGNSFDVVDVDGVERIKLPNGNILTTEASQEILTSVPVEGGDDVAEPLTPEEVGTEVVKGILTDPTRGNEGEPLVTYTEFVDYFKDVWRKTTEDRGLSIAGYTDETFDTKAKEVLEKAGVTEESYVAPTEDATDAEVTAEPFENALMAVLEKVDPNTPVTDKQLKTFVTREIGKSKGVFTLEDTDIIMNAIKRKLGM